MNEVTGTGVESSLRDSTGHLGETSPSNTIVYDFDKYSIVVLVGPRNEFLGIDEVRVHQDFLSLAQRSQRAGAEDVSSYYFDT